MQLNDDARRRAGGAAGGYCRGWTGRPSYWPRAARRGRDSGNALRRLAQCVLCV